MSTSPGLSGNTQDGRANLDDWRGVGDMVAITTEQVATVVEGMHTAIVDRWFGIGGPRVEPALRLANGMTALIYKTVRFGGLAVGATISLASELASDHVSLRPVWDTPKGRYVQSIFNGVLGDRLEDDESPLRIELGLRDLDGRSISPYRTSLSRAFPNPTGRLSVLVHGLGETERCWRSDHSSTLAGGLKAEGFSLLRLRYNTGRAVADNGSDLADLLEAIRLEWPVPVEEFALIGHSMGGLVAQSAVAAARSFGYRWADLTTHLVAIGTPHLGSPIEKGVEMIGKGLGLLRETRPLAVFLQTRSAGIKDLRHGVDNRPEGVQYHAVAGAVTTDPAHPLGVLVGDLVVRVGSAIGRASQHRVVASNVLVVGGRRHADLLHDPEVISRTREWLAQPS